LGIFESQSDIGSVLHAGEAAFDPATGAYTLTASGENMWAAEDDFHFLRKKMTGDVMITAAIAFPSATGNSHKKAALMIRRTLDPDSEYVDAALHLSGLTSLQSRSEKGGPTREVQSYISSPKRIRLVKTRGDFYMYVAGEDGVFRFSGGSMQLRLDGPFFIGLAACAHDKDAVERAVFSGVEIVPLPPSQGKPVTWSTLETETSDRRALWVERARFEAPHWSRDGKTIFFTRNGHMVKIPAAGGAPPEPVDSGNLTHIESNTGLSPDGTTLAVTDRDQIYILPAEGGTPRLLVKSAEFCDWSPDGTAILFIGIRDSARKLLTIPAVGGAETEIETESRVENPSWSSDGKYIYYDTVRFGTNEIWRTLADGSHSEQITTGTDYINSVPHPSPDGRQMAFLSANMDYLLLRSMDIETKTIRVMAVFPHAQGALAAQPWSPDAKTLAFVSYQNAPF
jgi:hypothetical protein